jgi:hypothetical protein
MDREVVTSETSPPIPVISRDEAISRLAERLYWNMQRLDTDIGAPERADLTERQRRFYRLLVGDLVEFECLIQTARGGSGGMRPNTPEMVEAGMDAFHSSGFADYETPSNSVMIRRILEEALAR